MNQKIDSEGASGPVARRRDWRRIHHSPLFWFGACLFMVAITVYVLSEESLLATTDAPLFGAALTSSTSVSQFSSEFDAFLYASVEERNDW
jgi:hypothetical protein